MCPGITEVRGLLRKYFFAEFCFYVFLIQISENESDHPQMADNLNEISEKHASKRTTDSEKMNIMLPRPILEEFIQNARENVDKDGNSVELLSYLFDDMSNDEKHQVIDYILYPKQTSTASKVDDNGE